MAPLVGREPRREAPVGGDRVDPARRPRRAARPASRGRRRRARRGRARRASRVAASAAHSDSESNCGASAAGATIAAAGTPAARSALGGARPGRGREQRSRPADAGRPRGEEVRDRIRADEDDQAARRQAGPRVAAPARDRRGGAISISGSATASMPRARSVSTQGSACVAGPRDDDAQQPRRRSGAGRDGSADAPAAR